MMKYSKQSTAGTMTTRSNRSVNSSFVYMSSIIQNSSFSTQNSSFVTQNSSFSIQNSSFSILNPSFVTQNPSFSIQNSSQVGQKAKKGTVRSRLSSLIDQGLLDLSVDDEDDDEKKLVGR